MTNEIQCITLGNTLGGKSMTTVRLPLDIEQKLEILSKAKHKSKTELIKEALENLFYQAESEKDS